MLGRLVSSYNIRTCIHVCDFLPIMILIVETISLVPLRDKCYLYIELYIQRDERYLTCVCYIYIYSFHILHSYNYVFISVLNLSRGARCRLYTYQPIFVIKLLTLIHIVRTISLTIIPLGYP
jgi:hypothetical protein